MTTTNLDCDVDEGINSCVLDVQSLINLDPSLAFPLSRSWEWAMWLQMSWRHELTGSSPQSLTPTLLTQVGVLGLLLMSWGNEFLKLTIEFEVKSTVPPKVMAPSPLIHGKIHTQFHNELWFLICHYSVQSNFVATHFFLGVEENT